MYGVRLHLQTVGKKSTTDTPVSYEVVTAAKSGIKEVARKERTMQDFKGQDQDSGRHQPDARQSMLKHALTHHVIPMLVGRNASHTPPCHSQLDHSPMDPKQMSSRPGAPKFDLYSTPDIEPDHTRLGEAGPLETRACSARLMVEPLVSALLADNQAAADKIVAILLEHSRCRSTILTEVFAPAAVMLGEMWREDTATFSDVTLGIAALSRMMRNLCEEVLAVQPIQSHKNAIIVSSARDHHKLLSCSGDQHQFGTQMVCQLLRLQGWQIRHIAIGDLKEAEQAVARLPLCFVGLSLGLEDNCAIWKQRLSRLRNRSCNKNMKIIVGGLGVSCTSDVNRQLDADKSFDNGTLALPYVEKLYEKHQIMLA